MNLDPDNCPRCGVSWVGEPIPAHLRHDYYGDHWVVNVVLIVDDDADGHERPQYYQCKVCDGKTPLTIWNRGYKNEFLAKVFMNEFECGSRGD